MSNIEHVLCIKKNRLPDAWVEQKSIVPAQLNNFIHHCSHAGFKFVPRPDAEKNPSLKQIIPYILIQTTDRKKTAIYSRNGSEKRLHDLKSIGIGGHINPIDLKTQNDNFEQILMTGMERELNEELEQRPLKDQPEFAGIISEDITDVGKVHLGAVFRILTDQPEQFIPGDELFDFKWISTDTVKKQNLELWSELALTLISEQLRIQHF